MGKVLSSKAERDARAHEVQGSVLNQTNRAARAIAEFERALALDPNLAAAHADIGDAKIFIGRAEETEARRKRSPPPLSSHRRSCVALDAFCRWRKSASGANEGGRRAAPPLDRDQPDFSAGALLLAAASRILASWTRRGRRPAGLAPQSELLRSPASVSGPKAIIRSFSTATRNASLEGLHRKAGVQEE